MNALAAQLERAPCARRSSRDAPRMLPSLPPMFRTLYKDTPFLSCRLMQSMPEALLRKSFGHKDWLMCGGSVASSMLGQLPALSFLGTARS